MKKHLKKAALLLAAMGIVFNVSTGSVMAASEYPIATSENEVATEVSPSIFSARGGMVGSIHRTNGSKTFKSDWKKTAYDGDAKLTYGFNTVLINEDYAWAYHTKREHSAEVGNAKGAYTSGKKKAGKVAKIEVRHSGSSIQYQNTWY